MKSVSVRASPIPKTQKQFKVDQTLVSQYVLIQLQSLSYTNHPFLDDLAMPSIYSFAGDPITAVLALY